MEKAKIKSFKDLIVWQKGHELVLFIYRLTQSFPKEETYSLIDQMRRSVVSITSNIAEGFSRSTRNDKIHFYFIAKGSLTELENQLLIARDLGYISLSQYTTVSDHILSVQKLLSKFISSTEAKLHAKYEMLNTMI